MDEVDVSAAASSGGAAGEAGACLIPEQVPDSLQDITPTPGARNYGYPDDFMMYAFKVDDCKRLDKHPRGSCPFAHPGDVARRRHPSRYQALLCPEIRAKKVCPRLEECQCSHSAFEFWLHPDRYRTSMCERGTRCNRPVGSYLVSNSRCLVEVSCSTAVVGLEAFLRNTNTLPYFRHQGSYSVVLPAGGSGRSSLAGGEMALASPAALSLAGQAHLPASAALPLVQPAAHALLSSGVTISTLLPGPGPHPAQSSLLSPAASVDLGAGAGGRPALGAAQLTPVDAALGSAVQIASPAQQQATHLGPVNLDQAGW
eukprot:gene1762-2102_t